MTLYPISDVAAISGVTSRTLRYYHQIGLLIPAQTPGVGQRRYDDENMRRLQRILILREFGLPLATIGDVLAEEADEVVALTAHRDQIRVERDRLARLITTLDKTIDELKGGSSMRPEELFDGFDADKQAQYEADLIERYGPQVQEQIDESWRRVAAMSKADAASINPAFEGVERALASLLEAGASPTGSAVQGVVAAHYQILVKFWTPDRESYAGLGQMYVDHPDFRARKDAVHPDLAEFERDAMAAYAEANLTS